VGVVCVVCAGADLPAEEVARRVRGLGYGLHSVSVGVGACVLVLEVVSGAVSMCGYFLQ
jgi:hypothetical protein